jgi:hypothetical protein
MTRDVGPDLSHPIVARGAAYADLDGDGDLDIVIATNDGPAYIYRNDGGNHNHWVTIKTVGTKSNRDGLGAVVTIQSASGTQSQMVRSGSSYCSQSQLALTFGLKQDRQIKSIEVRWPSGIVQKLGPQSADRIITITER